MTTWALRGDVWVVTEDGLKIGGYEQIGDNDE